MDGGVGRSAIRLGTRRQALDLSGSARHGVVGVTAFVALVTGRGFVHPRLGEAPDASSSTVTRPRWRFTKSLSIL